MGAEARLEERNITLPQPPVPVANYISAVRVGTLLFVSGHGPLRPDEQLAGVWSGGFRARERRRPREALTAWLPLRARGEPPPQTVIRRGLTTTLLR